MKIMSHEPTPSHSRSSSCEATETVKCPLTLVAVLKDEVYRDIELGRFAICVTTATGDSVALYVCVWRLISV